MLWRLSILRAVKTRKERVVGEVQFKCVVTVKVTGAQGDAEELHMSVSGMISG